MILPGERETLTHSLTHTIKQSIKQNRLTHSSTRIHPLHAFVYVCTCLCVRYHQLVSGCACPCVCLCVFVCALVSDHSKRKTIEEFSHHGSIRPSTWYQFTRTCCSSCHYRRRCFIVVGGDTDESNRGGDLFGAGHILSSTTQFCEDCSSGGDAAYVIRLCQSACRTVGHMSAHTTRTNKQANKQTDSFNLSTNQRTNRRMGGRMADRLMDSAGGEEHQPRTAEARGGESWPIMVRCDLSIQIVAITLCSLLSCSLLVVFVVDGSTLVAHVPLCQSPSSLSISGNTCSTTRQ